MGSGKREVVITGVGAITPAGLNFKENWENIIAGNSGIKRLTDRFPEQSEYPVHALGFISGEDELLRQYFSEKDLKKNDRFVHLGLAAAHEAIKSAGLDYQNNPEKTGVYMGVGIGGLTSIISASEEMQNRGMRRVSPYLIPKVISNQLASQISISYGLRGPQSTFVNACSSSSDAIGHSLRAIEMGFADCMIAGGSEAVLTPLALGGFGNMRALSSYPGDPKQALRPFDRDRSGFVMGEGGAVLVLETRERAEKRGAPILAILAGYGNTSDAYHATALHPEGEGGVRAVDQALAHAKFNKNSIGYINAHGTGTKLNDPVESLMIRRAFGAHADKIAVSSTKPITGHLLGGVGALECAITAQALFEQIVPGTINCDSPDEGCDLDYIRTGSREEKITHALSNSFGFGGANAVLALKRFG